MIVCKITFPPHLCIPLLSIMHPLFFVQVGIHAESTNNHKQQGIRIDGEKYNPKHCHTGRVIHQKKSAIPNHWRSEGHHKEEKAHCVCGRTDFLFRINHEAQKDNKSYRVKNEGNDKC